MKKETLQSVLVIAGAVLFNIIFWGEKLGINAVFFDLFIMGSVFYLYPHALQSTECKWLAFGNLISACMVLLHNTGLSETGCFITLLLLVAFSQYHHRSALYAAGSLMMNYIMALPGFLYPLKNIRLYSISVSRIVRRLRLIVFPAMIVFVFFIIYAIANRAFSNFISSTINTLLDWIERVFYWLSFPRLAFFVLGGFIISGMIIKARTNYFSNADMHQADILSRKKDNLKRWQANPLSHILSLILGRSSRGILALKNEFTIGIISLALLNVLLLVINFLDCKYVWFGFTNSKDINLSKYVHEGAELLIFSIVLAMLLLVFIFRGNLNFYKENKWLRYGAYLWIFQNLFLVVSVFIRDYYYISHYGLAYKRIGLLFFLAMVVTGLFTVYFKIRFPKTLYYLMRVNMWMGIFLLVAATIVNWDYTIAQYNLARKSSIPLDVPFLLSLSDKTLPLVEKNKDVLYTDRHTWYYQSGYGMPHNAVEFFENRKKQFFETQKKYTWLSWNAPDAYVKKNLRSIDISVLK